MLCIRFPGPKEVKNESFVQFDSLKDTKIKFMKIQINKPIFIAEFLKANF